MPFLSGQKSEVKCSPTQLYTVGCWVDLSKKLDNQSLCSWQLFTHSQHDCWTWLGTPTCDLTGSLAEDVTLRAKEVTAKIFFCEMAEEKTHDFCVFVFDPPPQIGWCFFLFFFRNEHPMEHACKILAHKKAFYRWKTIPTFLLNQLKSIHLRLSSNKPSG